MGKKSRLKKLRRQSIATAQTPIKGIIRKQFGKGTSDPFIVRMMVQIFDIRDFLFKSDSERRAFDLLYNPVFQNLHEAQHVKDKFIQTFENYKKRTLKGKGAKLDKGLIRVDDPIDFDLNIFFKDFFIRGHISLECLKKLTDSIFGINIEFLFQTDKKLEESIHRFLAMHPQGIFQYFIDMLRGERKQWFSTFIDMRIKIEHHGFTLPEVQYIPNKDGLTPILPKMGSKDMIETLNLIWENLFEFCEDVVVMMFATKIKGEDIFAIQHIPEHLRDPHKPIKYKISLKPPPELLSKMEFPNK